MALQTPLLRVRVKADGPFHKAGSDHTTLKQSHFTTPDPAKPNGCPTLGAAQALCRWWSLHWQFGADPQHQHPCATLELFGMLKPCPPNNGTEKGYGAQTNGHRSICMCTYKSLLKSLLHTFFGCICQIPILCAGREMRQSLDPGGLELLLPLISHPAAHRDSSSFLCPPPLQ